MRNMKNLSNGLTKTFHNVSFKLKKHSPEILMAVGVVGTVTSAVMACRATMKVNEVIEKRNKAFDAIQQCLEDPQLSEEYTEEDANKDITLAYMQSGVELVKLYAPAIALGTVSISCLVKSNDILRKRNVALTAAYATLNKTFKDYRQRVTDRFGVDVERELKCNIQKRTIEETVVDENGKETKVEKEIEVCGLDGYSEYARYFDETCFGWDKSPEYNLMFIKAQQNYANDVLKAKGRLFLNEVYDMLGMKPTKAGQIVGWVYDPENPSIDSYVDFGVVFTNRMENRELMESYETAILLDFNVDGNIWDTM